MENTIKQQLKNDYALKFYSQVQYLTQLRKDFKIKNK